MRIRISHLIAYRYETPATSVVQMLRLTPRNHDGQYVARWRIDGFCDTDAPVRVAVGLDELSTAPLGGTRYGGAGEALSVKVRVEQAAQQNQN